MKNMKKDEYPRDERVDLKGYYCEEVDECNEKDLVVPPKGGQGEGARKVRIHKCLIAG